MNTASNCDEATRGRTPIMPRHFIDYKYTWENTELMPNISAPRRNFDSMVMKRRSNLFLQLHRQAILV